jgi:3-deoxy-D-manno-octulosonic-acid transferase
MGVSTPWTLRLWRIVGRLIEPAIRRLIARRAAAGKEDRRRLGERFGHPTRPRPETSVLWLHAASVGELNSVLPLLSVLLSQRKTWSAVLTTGTVTSAKVAADHLPERAVHQYLPVDLPAPARRFLDHWRPDAAIFAESEFWPGLIGSLGERRVPLALVNGRVTAKAAGNWRWGRPFIRAMLRQFVIVLAQTPADAQRLHDLGAHDVQMLGNLKNAAQPLRVDPAEHGRLSGLLAGRACWIAASTHDGEEQIAWEVHRQVAAGRPDLLTVIAPRHPERGKAIAAMLASQGAAVGLRSRGDLPETRFDIYVADTLGELGLWYRLAEIAFIGGSLVPRGGQNLLEPARLGRAILFGPHVDNFAIPAKELKAAGAARQVANGRDLADAVTDLVVTHPDQRREMARRALAYAEASLVSLDRFMAALAPLFERGPAEKAE